MDSYRSAFQKPQNQKVVRMLLTKGELTANSARRSGIQNLSARVCEIRDALGESSVLTRPKLRGRGVVYMAGKYL